MRRFSFFLAFMAALLAAPSAVAETYSENFDASTSLPEGWSFLGGTFYTYDTGSTYYMNSDTDYSLSKKNCLCCPVSLPDQYVVSPKMTGQVTFYVRAYRSKRACSLHVYRCSDDGTEVGDEITAAAKNWSSSNTNTSWQSVTINLGSEGTRLAFNLYRVYLDDFSGELYEEGEERKGLSVVSVESLLDTCAFVADENNQVKLAFRAVLKNVGTVDLTPEEENYTVSLLNADGFALFQQPIGVSVPAGDTVAVTLTKTLTANSLITGKDVRFAVREDLTETMQYCPTAFTITAYLPVMKVYDTDPAVGYPQELTYQHVINYGNIAQPLTGTFYVKNTGNAPLVIPIITAPKGFTVAPDSLTVAPGKTESFAVTLEVYEADYGLHEGDVVLMPEHLDEFHLTVKGITRSPETVYVDFNDQQFPQGWTVGEGWRITSDFTSTDYYAEQYQYPVKGVSALITPKLEVRDGETLTFLARAYDTEEWYSAGIMISYSADRTKWTTLATLTDTLTTQFQSFELDAIPAGLWYIRFQAINAALDNIQGFRVSTEAPQLAVYDADPATEGILPLKSGTAVDFGSVDRTASRTFYLKNIGTGTLDVRSITAPEGFEVSLDSCLLRAGEVDSVVVSLPVGESGFGPCEGTLRIEAVDVDLFTLQLRGTTRDPRVFYTDFENGQLPEGWFAGEGWTITSTYGYEGLCADTHDYPQTVLVSPLMEVTEDDSLQLDAKLYGMRDWYPPTLRVSYSADRSVWYTVGEYTEVLTSAYQHFTVKDIPAGRWFLRVEAANIDLDNLHGYVQTDSILTRHLRGRVLDEDSVALVGATLTLYSGDTLLTTKTDGEGAFDIPVRKLGLEYFLDITHEDCDTLTDTIAAHYADLDTIYLVHRHIPVGIVPSIASDTLRSQPAFDLHGRRLPQQGRKASGLRIVGRRKLYVR